MTDLNNFELAIEMDWQARREALAANARVQDMVLAGETPSSLRRYVARALVAAAALLYPAAVPAVAR